jgi:cell division protein FtsB
LAGKYHINFWWPAILITAIIVCGVTLYRGLANFDKVQEELSAVRATNKKLDVENRALYRKVQRLRSDAKAQEQAARQGMGLVRPDELVYTDQQAIPAEAKQASAAQQETASAKGKE